MRWQGHEGLGYGLQNGCDVNGATTFLILAIMILIATKKVLLVGF